MMLAVRGHEALVLSVFKAMVLKPPFGRDYFAHGVSRSLPFRKRRGAANIIVLVACFVAELEASEW